MRHHTLITLLLGCSITSLSAQSLKDGFLTPPQEARPRVWWHWMDGNITKEGIRKDIEWMHRSGIGGFHCFEAGTGMKPVVEKRLTYLSPEWKDAFRYAITLADSMNMEATIASCPGWSNTGGPWVKPEQAMKRLVWSETRIKGGKQLMLTLPEPSKKIWYKDCYVLAVRLNQTDKTMAELGAAYSADLDDSPSWIQYEFKQPQTIKSLRIADGQYRSIWGAAPAPVSKHLMVSDDGKTFRPVCDIPHGSIYWQTINIAPTTSRYFRVVFDQKPPVTPELELYTQHRINHIEEKAGFASPSDMMDHVTTASAEDAVSLTDVIDLTSLTDTSGHLTWKAPKGIWKILRFGYTLTGKENHPAPREATGLEVSKIDKEAFTDFLNYYLRTYQDATGGLMGKRGLHYMLIDSYEAGWETWTPQMAAEFESRRGYSLLPWMPVLTGQIIESTEASETFLFDWRTTIGELIEECMYENAARIARQYGLETYFEAHENGRLYLVDGMSVKSKADIPMGAMWVIVPGSKAANSSESMAQSDLRESASVAHLYGRKYVAAESMTVNGEVNGAYCFYPGNLKATADLEMASGVNLFVIHESAHQPVDDKKPGLGLFIYGQWFNRHETWAEQAKVWTNYLARSSYLLQQGRNVADILYYYGEDDVITSLFAHQHPAIPCGYNFDYLNKEALLELISYDGRQFVTPSGSRYQMLVIDNHCLHFSPAVTQKIETLKQQGAPIVDLRKQSMTEAVNNLQPDFITDDMNELRYVHRSATEGEIYWINNRRELPRSMDARFRVTGLKPTLWHPETGMMEEVDYEIREHETIVHLDLVEQDAVFVVFSGKIEAGAHRPSMHSKLRSEEAETSTIRRIEGPWTVIFPEEQGGRQVFERLMSWTEADNKLIRYFSGTAVYHNQVKFSEAELREGQFILDLGQVGCMAEVIVNDKNLGILWKTPYQTDITCALKSGENRLEIRVVNTWQNRIIGDLQPDCEKPFTYTSHQFFKADSPLLTSGLIGPVNIRLKPIRKPSNE